MCKILRLILIIVRYGPNHQTGHIHRHSNILFSPLINCIGFTWVIVICLGMMESHLASHQYFPQQCFRKKCSLKSLLEKLPLKALQKYATMGTDILNKYSVSSSFDYFCSFCGVLVKSVAGIGPSLMKCTVELCYVWQHAPTQGKDRTQISLQKSCSYLPFQIETGMVGRATRAISTVAVLLYELSIHVMQPHCVQPLSEI